MLKSTQPEKTAHVTVHRVQTIIYSIDRELYDPNSLAPICAIIVVMICIS